MVKFLAFLQAAKLLASTKSGKIKIAGALLLICVALGVIAC
jgi:hypothetical protein